MACQPRSSLPSDATAGGLIAREDLEQLAWWAERRDVLIVSDECFAPFLYEGEWTAPAGEHRDLISLTPAAPQQLEDGIASVDAALRHAFGLHVVPDGESSSTAPSASTSARISSARFQSRRFRASIRS